MIIEDNYLNSPSSSFGLVPFDDTGRSRLPIKRTTTTFSGGYDTQAIDPFRQGVEVTTNRHKFMGNLPKLGAGNLSHQTKIQTYGQANNSIDREQSIVYDDKADNSLASIVNISSRSSDIFSISSSLVAWFPLNGNLNEYRSYATLSASYNSQNLSYSTGPISGTNGLFFGGTNQPMFGSTYSALKLTGSLSIELLWKPTFMNVSPLGDNHSFVSWGPLVTDSAETEARNTTYLFGYEPYNSRFFLVMESGSSTTDIYAVWSNTSFLSNSANWNQWYHIIMTKNSTTKQATLYLSGNSYGAQSWAPASESSGGTSCLFRLGGNLNSPQTDLSGTLAHVRVYDRVLTQGEVSTLYNQYLTATLDPYIYSGGINLNYPIELNGQEDPQDATMEPLTLPFKKPSNEPLYYPAHATRGNLEDGNEDNGLGGGNSQISQFIEYTTPPDRIATNQIYDETLRSNLLAYFTLDKTLDEYYGRTTLSASYNSQSVSFSNGPLNNSFAFFNTNTTTPPQLKANYSPLFLTGNMSVEVLFNPSQHTANEPFLVGCCPIVADATSNTNIQYGLVYDPADGRFYYTHQSGSNSFTFVNLPGIPSASAALNRWHHVIMTRNTGSRELVLYMSGNRISSGSYTLAAAPTGGSLSTFTICGQGSAFNPIQGAIGHVRMYNKVLTDSEVAYQYQQYVTASTIGYFRDNPNAIQRTRPFLDGGSTYADQLAGPRLDLEYDPVVLFQMDHTTNDLGPNNVQMEFAGDPSTLYWADSAFTPPRPLTASNYPIAKSDAFVSIGSPAYFSSSQYIAALHISGNLTMEAFFRENASGFQYLCGFGKQTSGNSGNIQYGLSVNPTTTVIRYIHQDGEANTQFVSFSAATNYRTNQYNHLAVTRTISGSSCILKAYCNGRFIQQQTLASLPTGGNNARFFIGGASNDSTFDMEGNVASVKILNKVLTDSEIYDEYEKMVSVYKYRAIPLNQGFVSSQHSLINPFSDIDDEKTVSLVQTTNTDLISALKNLDINRDEDIRQTFEQKSATAGGDVYGPNQGRTGTDSIAFRGKIRGS